jgi:hypothetical protein
VSEVVVIRFSRRAIVSVANSAQCCADRRADRRADGRADQQAERRADGFAHSSADGVADRCADDQADRCAYRCADEQPHVCTHSAADEPAIVRPDRGTLGRADGSPDACADLRPCDDRGVEDQARRVRQGGTLSPGCHDDAFA